MPQRSTTDRPKYDGPFCATCGLKLRVMTDPFGDDPPDPINEYCVGHPLWQAEQEGMKR